MIQGTNTAEVETQTWLYSVSMKIQRYKKFFYVFLSQVFLKNVFQLNTKWYPQWEKNKTKSFKSHFKTHVLQVILCWKPSPKHFPKIIICDSQKFSSKII